MATLEITQDHRKARNQASITLADAGAYPSTLRLYSEKGGALMATRTLAKPCGVLTAEGRISLQMAAVNDLALITGTPTWGEWCDGNGTKIAGAPVTDKDGAGPFKLSGAANGMVYEGGTILLKSPALLG